MSHANFRSDHVRDLSEQERLMTLESLELLDTPSEQEFDAVVRLAQHLTGCKIALVSLVAWDRQWFKAKVGIDATQTPREHSFCAHAIAADTLLVVPDASIDARFFDNPLVTGEPHIRFYAGIPIRARARDAAIMPVPLGTLCVIDDQSREVDDGIIGLLVDLAHLVETLISARAARTTAVRLADDRARHLQVLQRRHRQQRQAERMANIGSWRLDLTDNSAEWSEQTYVIHGVPVGDGKPLDAALDFCPPRARTTITDALERAIATGEPFDVETDFATAQGDYRRVRSMGEIELDQGKPVALIGVFQDITSRYMMEQALRCIAHTDELTRIANRTSFNDFVDEKIMASGGTGKPCALLLIDLDHFKAVNDTLGHHTGDEVLCLMASRLQASYLGNSFAARLGGDEFVLLITDEALLHDLRGLIWQLLGDLRCSVGMGGQIIHVTATAGACWLSPQIATRSELLRHADAALYEAKNRQRGSGMIVGESKLIVPDQDGPAALRLMA